MIEMMKLTITCMMLMIVVLKLMMRRMKVKLISSII